MEKICPFCRSRKIERDICLECRRKIKKRSSALLLLPLSFILLAACYPLFENSGLYIDVMRETIENVPYTLIKEVNVSVPMERYDCRNTSYRFTTAAGNVDSVGMNVRSNLVITNLEKEWGIFSVNFSYVDEEKFAYDIFGGKNLAGNLEAGKISSRDAEFYSENYYALIGPSESVTIRNLTAKADRKKQYWAIANIVGPEKTECILKKDNVVTNQTRAFTEYRQEQKVIRVKEYRKISELTGIADFSGWLVILILAYLILFLVIKIIAKLREFGIDRSN